MNENLKKDEVLLKAIHFMSYFSNLCSQISAYTNWSDKFCRSEINDGIAEIRKNTNKEFWDTIFDLSSDDKELLGFRFWDKDSPKMMIPLWIIECLPNGYEKEANSITGKSIMISNKLEDKDIRFGCTAYMI